MIVYLDTSAWVKLFINETGSDKVRQIVTAGMLTKTIIYPTFFASFDSELNSAACTLGMETIG